MSTPTIHAFYHGVDFDGKCSGAIVKKKYPEVILHPINYGQSFPWDQITKEDVVIMCDFSMQPFSDMLKLKQACNNFIWIDHHASAIKEWEESGAPFPGIRNSDFAGCELTWRYFFPNGTMPLIVQMLGRYDVFDLKSSPDVMPIQCAMRVYEADPADTKFWESLFYAKDLQHLVEKGKTIEKYVEQFDKEYGESAAFDCKLGKYNCVAMNRLRCNTQGFESVYDPSKHDLMLPFCWIDGQWTVSIYTDKENIDCGEIASEHGGGGHKRAAGFQCDELPFLEKKNSEPTVTTLHANEWLSLKEMKDPDNGVNGYVYSHEERCHGNIVAMLPFKGNIAKNLDCAMLIRKEVTPCWGMKPVLSSITGGVEENQSPLECAVMELKEEAGYTALPNEFIPLGTCRGTKSTDTTFHLFAINVTDKEQGEATGDGSELEAKATCVWHDKAPYDKIQDPLVSMMVMRLILKLTKQGE